jgi:nitrate/TMAO reductase-like tetraheme cytochrome c subunit
MSKWNKAHKLQFGLIGLAAGILILVAVTIFSSATSVSAAPLPQREKPSNETCLFCHQDQALSVEIGGQPLSLTINGDKFSTSVHGMEQLACVDCHSNITSFPHPEVTASSPRDFTLEMYPICQQCHGEQYQKVLDSVHQTALAGGNTNAAVCTDCHNPHTQVRLTDKDTGKLLPDARLHIPQTCAKCHSKIYDTYKNSVHGSALQSGNPDVPTCIDCHGVHNIQNPTTNTFRNSTPYLCAKCHTDESIMSKYGISTNVLNTYVADFHGTTVKMFEETYPDQPTNKPVCTDCHGIHDIVMVDNPNAGVAIKSNLLVKCQQCHPGATTDTFTEAWMSHYEPSPEKWPLVYYVNLFYKFFIPAVLGGMLVFVLSDVYRRFIARKANKEGDSHK